MLTGVTFVKNNAQMEIIFNDSILEDSFNELYNTLESKTENLVFNFINLKETIFYSTVSRLSEWLVKNKDKKNIDFANHPSPKQEILLMTTIHNTNNSLKMKIDNRNNKLSSMYKRLKFNM